MQPRAAPKKNGKGFVHTIGSALNAAAYSEAPAPLYLGVATCGLFTLITVAIAERGKLFSRIA